jgi:hypothetical protein
MVSYFKTQWWRLVIAVLCFVPIIITCCTSTATTETVEGLTEVTSEVFSCFGWFLASCCWLLTSLTSNNSDCIRELDNRVQYLEARAITDIEETGPNEYTVRRKLGPDKED